MKRSWLLGTTKPTGAPGAQRQHQFEAVGRACSPERMRAERTLATSQPVQRIEVIGGHSARDVSVAAGDIFVAGRRPR